MRDLGVVGVLRPLLQHVLGPQAVADVGVGQAEIDVPVHELAVHRPGLDDVVRDVVHDREVRARLEDHRHVGEIRRAVLVGGERRDPHMRMAEAAVGHPGPQDRVHLGHVRAPEHEGVGMLEIVVATHRLVHAEGADEGDGGGRHAVAGVRIEIVGAEARPHQLGGGIALPDRPLARAEHADRLGSLLLAAPASTAAPSRRRPGPRRRAGTRRPWRTGRSSCAGAAG